MKKHYQKIPFFILIVCTVFVILTAGCTINNPNHQENSQSTPIESITAETTQSTQSESTQPTVSWKDFYPDHTEQEKSELIEEAEDKIARIFPDLDRSTFNGEWIEHTRITDNGIEEIGSPFIRFENIKSTSDGEKYAVFVDPESMELTYYTPYGGSYKDEPLILSFNEAKEKAIDFIRETQGEDSTVDDPDAYMYTVNEADEEFGRPVAAVYISKTYNGVPYMNDYVMAEYDMSRGYIERYHDNTANSELLSGLTTLPAEPDITFEDAIKIFEDTVAEKYDVDKLEFEYSMAKERYGTTNNLIWFDTDDIIYADGPEAIPLVWLASCSDKKAREEAPDEDDEDYVEPNSGGFLIDAHTGEIYRLRYGDIKIKEI